MCVKVPELHRDNETAHTLLRLANCLLQMSVNPIFKETLRVGPKLSDIGKLLFRNVNLSKKSYTYTN